MALETNTVVIMDDVASLKSFTPGDFSTPAAGVEGTTGRTGVGMTVRDHVREMLVDLRDATSTASAEAAMKVLEKFIDVIDSDKEREKARIILELNGVSTIVVALWKWQASQDFCMFAMATLCDLVYLEEETKKVIVDIGGVDTILMATQRHSLLTTTTSTSTTMSTATPFNISNMTNKENSSSSSSLPTMMMGMKSKKSSNMSSKSKKQLANDLPLKSNAVGLLGSLSFSDISRHVVATEECIDFVLSTMKLYPNHTHMQKWGCIFIFQISKDIEIKTLLEEKKNVITQLATIIDTFRTTTDNNNNGGGGGDTVIEKAKPALRLFLD